MLLPGGVKRSQNDINDDNKPIIQKSKEAFNAKLVRDFNSNISCLPGNMINTEPSQRSRLISARRYETSDIFNRNPANNTKNNLNNHNAGMNTTTNTNYNNYNSFKVSNAKPPVNRNIYEESKGEKKLIDNGKSKRPDFIRNPFASQITIV